MSFKRFDTDDITLSAESVVAPLWSTDQYQLTTFHTSSAQEASNTGNYFLEVYHQDPATTGSAEVQFAIAYGNINGGGALDFTPTVVGVSPSSVIYGQYRNLILGDEGQKFRFSTEAEIDNIYVISVDRARYKEKLLPGSFNLTLTIGGNTLELTDNSKEQVTSVFSDAGRMYQIISGSNGESYLAGNQGYTTSSGSYGILLPDIGVIILNGDALDLTPGIGGGISLNTEKTQNTVGNNTVKLYTAIKNGLDFRLRSEETITSNFVFVRVRNSEYNYTTNPSNISDTGELTHDVMINNPQAYLTTVGLYNDSNDLVAVAKLSRPLLKDFSKEALVRIKLDF
jgi:hypothetical protein